MRDERGLAVDAPLDHVAPPRPRDLPVAGLDVAELVALLRAQPLADLADADVVGAAVGWQQVIDAATAAQADAVAELAARRPASASFPADDLACALATTHHGALALVGRAAGLADHPVLADALRAGALDPRKVDVLLDEVAHLPRDAADEVLRRTLADDPGLTAPLLRRRVRRLVAASEPEAAARRAARARTQRTVRLEWATDSMAWVGALLPGPDAVAAFTVVDTIARAGEGVGDVRTLDQRRADAFAHVFGQILQTGSTPDGQHLPTRHGLPVGVQVTLAASTLVGLDDLPGELAGYGPVPAAVARDLASQAERYRPVLTDDHGHLLALAERLHPMGDWQIGDAAAARPPDPVDLTGACGDETLGRHGYRPDAALRRLVLARDETCTFPGCRRPAVECDLDHIEPFDPSRPAAAQTCPGNLQPLCRRHHVAKTRGGWLMRRVPATGDVLVTSPFGLDYVRPATRIVLTEGAYRHGVGHCEPPPAERSRSDDDGEPPF